MSSQHKLYNYEVAPPAEAWERIAQELEGVNDYRTISQKLQNLQVAPPAFAWETISKELDDQQSFDIIAKKLSAVEVAPPASIWHKIEGELNSTLPALKKEAVVVPLRRRLSKYAATAAVLGILILAGYFLAQRSSRDVDVIQQSLTDNNSPMKASDPAPVKVQSQNKIKTVPVTNTADSTQPATPSIDALPSQSDDVVTTSNGYAYTTTVEKNHEVDGRYIVLMTEEGNVVRLNKKVSGMADCITGEHASQQCNHQIEEWQKELASIPVLASPDNILGLLELANKPIAGL